MNYRKLMKPYENDMITALGRFISIGSVYDESTKSKTKPFGENVDKALAFVADLGERFGFEVDRCDGYCTELTIGDGDRMIGIFAHADVVPVVGEWKYGPFNMTIEDGNIYGRGSSDDKGPLIAAFYAIKALKDNGLLKGYRVRMVVGGDEERGSGCLEYYFNKLEKPYPDYGFTPDSDFPLIYGEKGIRDFYPELRVTIPNVKSIKGGVASNAVCDEAVVELEKEDKELIAFLEKKNVKFTKRAENIVVFHGKACHGSTPELGENAALIALATLGEFYKVDSVKKIGEELQDTSGKAFGCFRETKLLGKTTYCVGIIDYKEGELKFTVNFRYPEETATVDMIGKFNDHFGTVASYKEESPIVLFDPETPLVQTLLNAYRAETKDMTPPLTTGGGTYAKHAKNTIAFGALYPGRVSTMHEANELMPLKDFYECAVIYARAINDLGNLK